MGAINTIKPKRVSLMHILLLLHLKLRGDTATYNQETQDVRVEGGEGGRDLQAS